MKARTKFAIGLITITVVLSLAMLGGLEVYKNQQIDDTRRAVNETASLAATQISTELEQRRDYVGYIASRPRAQQFDRAGEYLGSFLNNSRFYAAQMIHANGTVVAFRGDVRDGVRRRVVGSDLSSETYVQEALDGRVYVSDVEYAPRVDRHLLIISAPIFDDEQRIKGVFAAAIYMNENTFFGAVRPLRTSKQSIGITNGSAILLEQNKRFEKRITERADVSQTGWTVTVSRDASGLLQELQWLAVAQGGGLFVLLSLVVVFGYWQYATNLRQAEQLLDAFDRLRAGQFDRSLSFGGGEEWTRIADGFNEMAERLEAREQAIQERERRLSVLNRVLRHNLRNDMSVIIGQAKMIPGSDGAVQKRAVEKIVEKGEQLVNRGQKARRIEEAMEGADEGRLAMDATKLVSQVVRECREDYPEATIRTALPDEQPVLAIGSLQDAVRNLVENAIEHNDRIDPIVEIEVTDAGDGRISTGVMDNGPGVPDHERRLFAEGQNETKLHHSTGLGLWFVRWVVERSGGTVRFEEGIDGGTKVELELEKAPSGASLGETVDASPEFAVTAEDD